MSDRNPQESMGSRTTSGPWTPNGELDGRYQIIERIAVTDRCEIYLAKELQPPLDEVVVKRLKPDKVDDNDARTRFEREVAVLRQIRHQSVLSIYDARTIGENRYFVTELADKGSLRDYLEGKPNHRLRPTEALDIALSVCKGLDAVHRRGIIHRDIKPGNILLFSQSDGSTLAKLADFGIAHVPGGKQLTQTELLICTPAYASPEQLDGKIADARSDLYSWAMVFFEMLTGEAPTESLKHPMSFEPASDELTLSFFTDRGVPHEFATVLQKALHKSRELRYQSAEEIQTALDSIRSQVIADISQNLSTGEAHIKNQDWVAASAAFRQGLALCKWFGEPHEFPDLIREPAKKLNGGLLCAQGMIHLAERQWSAAIEALGQVRDSVPAYINVDIAAKLNFARLQQQLEQKYQLLLKHKELGQWEQVLRLAVEFTTEYKGGPDGESIGEIRKLAIYAHGRKLLEEYEFERAYSQFYRLYETDPNYMDVVEQCASTAYRNAMRADIPLSWEHQVEWLEKAIKVDPGYKDSQARRQLDKALHRWAKELLDKGNERAAVAQLEEVSRNYNQWTDVQSTLVQIYKSMGQEAYRERRWRDAAEWWGKAVGQPHNLNGKLRSRLRDAKMRAWIDDHDHEIKLVGLVSAVLAVVLAIWQPWQGGGFVSATATPTPTATEIPPTLTPTVQIVVGPSETTATAAPTRTATRTPTPTLSPSATHTRTPSPTPTDTPTFTRTSTRTPTRIRTSTPTSTFSPTPTPTEPQPEPPEPTPPTPPPTPPTPPTL